MKAFSSHGSNFSNRNDAIFQIEMMQGGHLMVLHCTHSFSEHCEHLLHAEQSSVHLGLGNQCGRASLACPYSTYKPAGLTVRGLVDS